MTLRERVAEVDPEALLADGFDEACIGICYRASQPPVVAYSREKCIEILMDQGLSWEDAEEHFEFNVVGAWVGDHTPVFIAQLEEEEEEELPPKPPRAQGVTLDTLRKRMFQPFYDNFSRGLAAIDRESGGVLSKYADTPVTDVPDLTPEALDASRRNFEPPAPVFVPPGTVLRDDLGNLPGPGDLPKRSRKEIGSDIENTRLNITTSKSREERDRLRRKLADLLRERDDLEKS